MKILLMAAPLWIFMSFMLLNFLLSFAFSATSIVVAIGVLSYLVAITRLLVDADSDRL